MRKYQIPAVLTVLAADIAIPSVLLIGSNATGPAEITAALGNERLLLGFYDAGGTTRQGAVYYGDRAGKRKGRLTFGELSGQSTPRLEAISAVFQGAGIPVVACANMDAWLKTHAALILPIAGALYLAGGDTLHLAEDRTALAWMARRNMTIVHCQCPILG